MRKGLVQGGERQILLASQTVSNIRRRLTHRIILLKRKLCSTHDEEQLTAVYSGIWYAVYTSPMTLQTALALT